MTRIISFWLLVAIIVAVALAFYRVMSGFLLPLFLAAMLVVIFKPMHEWIAARIRAPLVSAAIATVLVVVVVFVPMVWSLIMAANEAISVARQFDANRVTRQIQRLQVLLDLDLPLVEEILDLDPLFDDLIQPSTVDEESMAPLALAGPPPTDTAPLEFPDPTNSAATPNEKPEALMPAAPPHVPFPIERLATLATIRRRTEEISRQLPEVTSSARREVGELRTQVGELRDALRHTEAALDGGNDDEFRETARTARTEFDRLKSMLPGGVVRVGLKRVVNPNPEQIREFKERIVREVQEILVPAANATVGFTVKLIFGTIIMIVSVFFFFADGPRMTTTVMRLIPLDVRHQQELLDEFSRISRAVVVATLVSAVVQGVLAGIGFYFASSGSIALLVLLTIVFAMIPFVGALSVWVPVCVWMGFVEGRVWTAVLLAIYCAIVVSQSDNVVKPLILKGQSNIHPLLALLSILGGVQALGPVGILVGPMVVVFLQTLLNILHREMTSLERHNMPRESLPGQSMPAS